MELQEEAVARVRAAGRDCYRLLGVGRRAGVEEVRAAYRRQALLLHPDKNKAPGAGEAFQAVSGAYERLSGGGRGGRVGGGAEEDVLRRFTTRKPSEKKDVIDLDSDDEEDEFNEFTRYMIIAQQLPGPAS